MRKLILFFFLFTSLVVSLNSCDNSKDPHKPSDNKPDSMDYDVSLWLTTGNESALFIKQGVDFSKETGDFTIVLDSTETYQTIDGFGAALTGSSAYLINKMSKEKEMFYFLICLIQKRALV